MITPDKNIKQGAYWKESYIKKNFPEFYQYIIDNYPHDITWTEKLYWWKNNINEYPTCIICGNRVSFHKANKYYHKYCSSICCGKSEEAKKKRIETSLKLYGVPHYHNNDKLRLTCLQKYGVENISQSDVIKEKKRNTCLKRYGTTTNLHSKDGEELVKKTMRLKYGEDYYTNVLNKPENKENNVKKILTSNRRKFLEDNKDIIGYDENQLWMVKCKDSSCKMCNEKYFSIMPSMYYDRTKNKTTLCTKQNPPHSNQSSLEKYIKDILNEYNIIFIERDRSILNNHELDIFIPSKKIAIECNGCYWHSSNNKPNHYHEEKYLKCKEKGIQLISIWEDWVRLHPEIVKSLLLSKLNIYDKKIYARKCEVKEIGKEYVEFLNQNHIQGKTNATIKLGIFYNDSLEGVMTFSKRSKLSGGKNDDCWELTRFCTKLNTNVIGGASKLLKYFIKQHKPSNIISFSSNDISNGELYKKLGFVSNEKITSAYWYVNQKSYLRYHRTSFTKTRLKQLGYNINNKTESEIMKNLPFYKIYDSGHTKWNLKILNQCNQQL